MKTLKQFLKETPTNGVGNGGYTSAGGQTVAGYDTKLFSNDDLTQDYQTPGESGQAKWRFSDVYPVLKLSLSSNCLLYTSPSPRDQRGSRMPSSA